MPTTRIKAAALHFIISFTLSVIVIGLLYFGWYPHPYFVPLGGLLLLAMIVGIDMVLGPLMTMILFNPAKSRRALLLDLTLIAIVQISALGYGLYSGYTSRIVFKVFDGKRFHLVQAADIPANFLKRTQRPEYHNLPFFKPRDAAVSLPDTPQARENESFVKAFGLGAYALPEYYVSLPEARQALATASIKRQALQAKNPALASRLDDLLSSRNAQWDGIAVIPFEVKTDTFTAVVRLDPVEIIEVLPEDPR